jgi:hypothetical protein
MALAGDVVSDTVPVLNTFEPTEALLVQMALLKETTITPQAARTSIASNATFSAALSATRVIHPVPLCAPIP